MLNFSRLFALNETRIQEAARLIAKNRLARIALPSLSKNLCPNDVSEGYQLQREVHRILANSTLGRVIGHKIGATNARIQEMLGVHHPCSGGVYASTVFHGSAVLRLDNYVRPGIECEIAFRMGRDLPPRTEPYRREDLSEAIDACMVAMEIIDDRYEDLAHIHVPTLIADDTLDAGIVLGAPHADWRNFDLQNVAGTIEVDGTEFSRGTGANVLGHPLEAMVWIANLYSGQGRGLRAGEFVSTGSIADIYWAKAGNRIVARVEGLGLVEAIFL